MARTVSRANHLGDRMTEAQLQRDVIALATMLGYRRIYHTYDSRRSAAGFPDLVLLRVSWPQRMLFVELKSVRGVVTPEQRAWLDDLDAFEDTEIYIWRPSHWLSGEIERVLR